MKFRKNLPLWMRACGRIISYSGKRYASDQLAQQAVVLTYYTLFSVVPLGVTQWLMVAVLCAVLPAAVEISKAVKA